MHSNGSRAEKPARALRVRFRRLDQVDEAKLALALVLMARRLSEEPVSPDIAGRRDDAAARREVA